MREIKFRAWDEASEIMVSPFKITDFGATDIGELRGIEGMNDCEAFLKHAKIMQYTGLKDKNGKEIYEGDIVKVPDDYETYGFMSGEEREIIFSFGGFRFKPKAENINDKGHWLEDDLEFEIIGNIYANPELK